MRYSEYLIKARREYWEELLSTTNHNISEVSRISGVKRTNIYAYLRHAGVSISRDTSEKNQEPARIG